MWQDDDPPEDPRWMNLAFAVFGTLYALAIVLNFANTIVMMLR